MICNFRLRSFSYPDISKTYHFNSTISLISIEGVSQSYILGKKSPFPPTFSNVSIVEVGVGI